MMNDYWRLREATATTEREGATRAVRSDGGKEGLSGEEGGAWVSQSRRSRQSCPHTEAGVQGESARSRRRGQSHNRYNVSSVPQAALEDPEG